MANSSVADFKRRLERIPASVRSEAFGVLVSKVQQLANAIKQTAPEEDGALKASVRQTIDPSRLMVTVRAGGPSTTRPVRNGATVLYDYALGQEFGTEKMPANPFFWPTYRTFRKPIRAATKRAITKAIKKHFPVQGD